MPDNKNQHYVPRVHLKPFTLDGENSAINLLNIDHMKFVPNAPVKNQCSGDYFYGQDKKLECAISSIENPYGEVVRFLMSEEATINHKVCIVLLRFIHLQYVRTDAASQKAAEMARAMIAVPGSDLPAPSVRDAKKVAVQLAMRNFADVMGIVDDLKVCVLRNLSPRPFFTSDNPAILTNRLHIQRHHKFRRSFGLKSAGAILILPLSSNLCALIYDSAVYTSPQRSGWIDVTKHADVDAINEHQILNCTANLYFREWDGREALIEHVIATQGARPQQRNIITHATLEYSNDWEKKYTVKEVTDLREEKEVLVHVSTNHPRPSAWPSILRFRADARAYSNRTGAGLTRRWCLDEGYVTGHGYRKIKV